MPVRGSPGFLVNRILMPYMLEAIRALGEGIPGAVLDRPRAVSACRWDRSNWPTPVGLDVAASVGQELAPFLGLELPQGVSRLLDAGKRGKKDGQGFYRWQDGKPVKPEVPKDYQAPEIWSCA
ncbi:fatty oxidation complex, alpha subunit [mine drainage metagenome]|uniref:Fatty oxidation complex, alpha subunit n=1 Tax=mine drainage metagenome TaxID=410659 RepID=T1CA77_9ZZZZ